MNIFVQINKNTMINSFSNLKEIQQYIKDALLIHDRVECPCCKQSIGKYKRRINKSQVLFLIELYRYYMDNRSDLHCPYFFYQIIKDIVKKKYNKHPSDYTKLQDWGLIVSKGDISNATGVSSGYWSITKKGIAFLDGKNYLPKYLYQTSQGETFKESDETVHISNYYPNFNIKDLKI